jgi:aspartyl-tRNA(Asn)/glutamyl-tRNA(Gln) amidotransferase subunit A
MAITKLSQRLARGELTSVALVQSCLDRIASHDAKLDAFVNVFDGAMAQAEKADKARQGGQVTGPFHGIPIAVKDLFHIQGAPARAGSASYATSLNDPTASAVKRLEKAGFIIIGKTATDEFAFGAWGVNDVCKTPWNPRDMSLQRVAGGSSSGSAVAVSAGLVPVALGSDTGASSRVPAAFCGCVGLKPSYGLIPADGVVPLCPSLDTVGLLASSIDDLQCLLPILADGRPLQGSKPGSCDIQDARIGILPKAMLESCDDEVADAYIEAVESLRSLGASISVFEPATPIDSILTDTVDLVSAEIFAEFGALAEDESAVMQPFVRRRILAGRGVTRQDYVRLLKRRRAAIKTMQNDLVAFDAIVTPTCPKLAIPVADVDLLAPATPFARFVNYFDLAGLSVPCGLTKSGLPIGLQFVVKHSNDWALLNLGARFEALVGALPPAIPGALWA